MTKSMDFDTLGDRMKRYEQAEAGRQLMPGLPVLVRLDGHAFHTFTKGLARPYHEGLSETMIRTTSRLVEKYQADLGYTQSDEITLVFAPKGNEEFQMFNGKYQKLCSLMAATASVRFNSLLQTLVREKEGEEAEFDCRVWNVPSMMEASNALLWRQMDAVKNSVSMAAQSVFSNSELHGQGTRKKIDMMRSKGIIWDDYPKFFKQGTFVRWVEREETLSQSTWDKIPEKHRPPRDHKFLRRSVEVVSYPRLSTITNPVDVLFNGADPCFP